MAGLTGKAEIIIETDDQYTVSVSYTVDATSDTATRRFGLPGLSNATLGNAVNHARDTLAALTAEIPSSKHRVVTMTTRVES